ncbi:MAG: hypothetical protein DMG37_03895 [Acidobacteria bacterium]|nr:MAG: hypothetical protein DMG37_03895 [Acidobacteriota bacterium]
MNFKRPTRNIPFGRACLEIEEARPVEIMLPRGHTRQIAAERFVGDSARAIVKRVGPLSVFPD